MGIGKNLAKAAGRAALAKAGQGAKHIGNEAIHKAADVTGGGARTDRGKHFCDECNLEIKPNGKGHMNGCGQGGGTGGRDGAEHSGDVVLTVAEFKAALAKGQKFKHFRKNGPNYVVKYL